MMHEVVLIDEVSYLTEKGYEPCRSWMLGPNSIPSVLLTHAYAHKMSV